MQNRKSIILCFFLLCQFIISSAQVIFNQNVIYSSTNGLIYCPDSVINNGNIKNNGNFILNGFLENNMIVAGNGNYRLSGNMEDNGTILDSNSFYFNGDTQTLSGSSLITSFWRVILENSGPKIFEKKAAIRKDIFLSNIELQLLDSLFVENIDTGNIHNEFLGGIYGFFSASGSNARVVVNSFSLDAYFVPLGSYLNGYLYRPIKIIPQNNDSNKYACMLFPQNPDNESYFTDSLDNSLCYVDSQFYYKIQDISQDTSFDIIFNYIPSDGIYNTVGYFQNKWLPCNFIGTSQNGVFSQIQVFHGNENYPLTLAYRHANTDSLIGKLSACVGENVLYQIQNSENFDITWYITGGNIVSENNNYVSVIFNSLQGNIFYTFSDQCTVTSDSISVNILSPPQGGFIIENPNILYEPVTFTDTTQNGNFWDWDFGNGYTSNNQIGSAYYTEPGNYTVTLIVTDSNGCKDTVTKNLNIEQIIKIPNIFTPNGDGINDYFQIIEMGLENYTIEVFNRWGNLIYKGGKGTAAWDGKTPAGDNCTTGTYFYTFTGKFQDEKKITKNGTIYLSR